MPLINIKITDEGVTKEQKQSLIEGATQLMVDVLNLNSPPLAAGTKPMGFPKGRDGVLPFGRRRGAYPVDDLNLIKNPATTMVIIDEVNTDNWGIGAKQVTELRKQS